MLSLPLSRPLPPKVTLAVCAAALSTLVGRLTLWPTLIDWPSTLLITNFWPCRNAV